MRSPPPWLTEVDSTRPGGLPRKNTHRIFDFFPELF
nr:MAG TPA: hypothetical protein [Caudoviricetes sp.]